jgi:hypothetical protein
MANPRTDAKAATRFNDAAKRLWVPLNELKQALVLFQRHGASGRIRERDNPFVNRRPELKSVPPPPVRTVDQKRRADPASWTFSSHAGSG